MGTVQILLSAVPGGRVVGDCVDLALDDLVRAPGVGFDRTNRNDHHDHSGKEAAHEALAIALGDGPAHHAEKVRPEDRDHRQHQHSRNQSAKDVFHVGNPPFVSLKV